MNKIDNRSTKPLLPTSAQAFARARLWLAASYLCLGICAFLLVVFFDTSSWRVPVALMGLSLAIALAGAGIRNIASDLKRLWTNRQPGH